MITDVSKELSVSMFSVSLLSNVGVSLIIPEDSNFGKKIFPAVKTSYF
jgi:hypothetical protein